VSSGRGKPHNWDAQGAFMPKGYKHSPETRAKISAALMGNKSWTGRKHTEEEKRKIGDGNKGLKHGKETREVLSRKLAGNKNAFGSVRTQESRRRLSELKTGSHHTAETRKKIATSLIGNTRTLGLKMTQESRNKIAAAGIGNKYAAGTIWSVERRAKKAEEQRGKTHTEETKQLMREKRRLLAIPFKDTGIEIKIQTLLAGKRVAFKKHVPLIGQPDVFIEPNICIFCDGNYWHNRPGRKEKDMKTNISLRGQGYKVIRLWEEDINTNIEWCWGKIKEVIHARN